MGKRLSGWIQHRSTGAATLTALVIFVLFSILVLPGQSGAEGGATRSPDLSFYYTGSELNHMAEAYGKAGREAYVRARFSFDIIWPLVYTFFLCTSISWLAKRGFLPESPWQQANLVPLLGALFDLFENLAASAVMINYPRLLPFIAWLAGFFTFIKWTLVGGSFLLLLTCIIAAGWSWWKGRNVSQE